MIWGSRLLLLTFLLGALLLGALLGWYLAYVLWFYWRVIWVMGPMVVR